MSTDPASIQPGRHVSDLLLERYRLGELSADDCAGLGRRLAADADLARRLRDLANAEDATLQALPPGTMAREVLARVDARPTAPGTSRLVGWVLPAALATAVALLAIRPGVWVSRLAEPEHSPAAMEGDRPKGTAAALAIYRNGVDGVELLHDSDVAHAGDVIRVGYHVSTPGYGVIVSVDGRGIVTRHWPLSGDRAGALHAGGTILLDRAFELDDAPRVERFFFVTAPDPFDVDAVVRAAGRSGGHGPPLSLAVPARLTVTTFSLLKEQLP